MIPARPVHPRAFETVAAQDGRVGTLSSQFAALLIAAGLREPWNRKGHGHGRGGRRAGSELSISLLAPHGRFAAQGRRNSG